MRAIIFSLAAAAVCFATPLAAQDDDDIVVQGELDAAEQQVESLTEAITRRPRIDKPISRQYGAVCLGVSGLSPEFAYTLIDRIESNARDLGIYVQGPGCQVNTLVSFTRDSRAEVERLRKEQEGLFSTLLDYEYDRIMRGNGAVQAWQATQLKGANGKEFASAVLGDIQREIEVNKQFSAGHLAQQLRVDILGSIVVFDNAFVPGKTIQQLADYATMRLFAPTDDLSDGSNSTLPTILTLFAEGGDAPDGLTEFDHAYLNALYKLPSTARASQMSDAARSAYRQAMNRDHPGPRDE